MIGTARDSPYHCDLDAEVIRERVEGQQLVLELALFPPQPLQLDGRVAVPVAQAGRARVGLVAGQRALQLGLVRVQHLAHDVQPLLAPTAAAALRVAVTPRGREPLALLERRELRVREHHRPAVAERRRRRRRHDELEADRIVRSTALEL